MMAMLFPSKLLTLLEELTISLKKVCAGLEDHEAREEGALFCLRRWRTKNHVDDLEKLVPAAESQYHLAVRSGDLTFIKGFLDHATKAACCRRLVNSSNCSGETPLHIAAAQSNVQVFMLLLEHPSFSSNVDLNSKNNDGVTVMGLLDAMADGNEKTKMKEALNKVASRTIKLNDRRSGYRRRSAFKPFVKRSSTANYQALLLVVTIIACTTFHVVLPVDNLARLLEEAGNTIEHISMIKRLLVLFNSLAFFTSVGTMAILLQDFGLQPWLFISIASTSAAYICSVVVISEREAIAMAVVGIAILTAAFLNWLAWKRYVFDWGFAFSVLEMKQHHVLPPVRW